MEYRIQRKVSFIEEAYIDADDLEDLKEKLKTEKLDWDVDFDCDPNIEYVIAYDEGNSDFEFPADIMEEDYVAVQNGCIIFNKEEFDEFHDFGCDD